MKSRIGSALGMLALLSSLSPSGRAKASSVNAPKVDHLQHLLSPAAAVLTNVLDGPKPPQANLPPDVLELLARRADSWNDAQTLAQLYAPHVVANVRTTTAKGAATVSETLARTFKSPYQFQVVESHISTSTALIAAYLVRGEGGSASYFGMATLTLSKSSGGRWLIDGEGLQFPGPRVYSPMGATDPVALMDAADVDRAVVLSMAYIFGSPLIPAHSDERTRVREENDWTAAQAARFPSRMVAFCSVNPLRDYAIAEMEHCVRHQRMRGLKLHFATPMLICEELTT